MLEYRYDRFRREYLKHQLGFGGGKGPGRQMPDFDLPTVAGGRVRKSDFTGRRPVLLTFASITDPLSASATPVLRRLHREFCEEVAFVTVYVREAHPGDRIPQPRTFDWKFRHARMLRERDGIPWPVAVDELDGALHRALGANSSAAYLMDPNGNVAFRTLCSNDERVLRAALAAVSTGRADHPFERARRVLPMARGLARVDDVLTVAGPRAIEDLRREAPIVFAAAEIAWAWRALTPLGRLAVVATVAAAAAGAWATVRRVTSAGVA